MRALGLALLVSCASSAAAQAAPVREVREALVHSAADVQRCGAEHPPPGSGTTRRLRVRVWLQPDGRWTMEIPELTQGSSDPNQVQLEACVQRVVVQAIGPIVRPFHGATRTKAERAFTVHLPGPPPPVARLVRLVTARRAQLLRCVPGVAEQGENGALQIRATLTLPGRLELIGVGVPEALPFEAIVECVRGEINQISTNPVTSTASFETQLAFHFAPPAVPPPPGAI